MKNAEMKVVRFDANDVIATSEQTIYTFGNLGNNTKGDGYISSGGTILFKNDPSWVSGTKDTQLTAFMTTNIGTGNYNTIVGDSGKTLSQVFNIGTGANQFDGETSNGLGYNGDYIFKDNAFQKFQTQ